MNYTYHNIFKKVNLVTVVALLALLWIPLLSYSRSLEKEDPNKIQQLLDSAAYHKNLKQKKALEYYFKALALAKTHKVENYIGEAYYGIINHYYNQFDYYNTAQYADSLLINAPTEKYRMLALERKGDAFWYTGEFDSAGHYYHKVKIVAEEIQDTVKLATVQRDLGDYYRQIGDYKNAITYFNNSIDILTQIKDTAIIAGVYNNFSIVFSNMGEFHKELEYLLKAFELKKHSNEYASLALYNKNIADVYIQLREYDRALEKSKEAIQLLEKDPLLRYSIYVNETVGRLFYQRKEYDSAKRYFTMSLILSDSIEEKRYQARTNKALGDIETKNNNSLQAHQYYQKASNYYQLINDPVHEANTCISMALNLLKMGKPQLAFKKLMNAKNLASTHGNKIVLIEVYKNLAHYYEGKNDLPKSLSYFKKLDSLKQTVFNEDRAKYISVNEIMFDTKMREIENVNLKNDIAIQNVLYGQQANRLKIGVVIIIACIAIAIILYYAYRKTRISQLRVAINNKELQKKNKVIEQANKEQLDLIHLVAHDLKSPLNKIQGLASILKLENGLTKEQSDIVQMMEETTNNSRKFIINLLEAHDVEKMALEPKLKNSKVEKIISQAYEDLLQMAEVKNQKVQLSNNINQNLFINIDKELFKHALLNLFSNAIKFSPSETTIYFEIENDQRHVYFHVKDEGPGFTSEDSKMLYNKFQKLSAKPTNNESSTGLGLYLVKSLVQRMKGTITLLPSPIGAHFCIQIPFIQKALSN